MNKPLFKPLIDSFPGLAEELKALDVAQPQQEPTQREPLTDEEILSIARDHYTPHQRPEISFARAIEAAHGITGESK